MIQSISPDSAVHCGQSGLGGGDQVDVQALGQTDEIDEDIGQLLAHRRFLSSARAAPGPRSAIGSAPAAAAPGQGHARLWRVKLLPVALLGEGQQAAVEVGEAIGHGQGRSATFESVVSRMRMSKLQTALFQPSPPGGREQNVTAA